MADITEAFYVTDLIGMGVNQVTGDYSRGASGFLDRKRQSAATRERSDHRRHPDRHIPCAVAGRTIWSSVSAPTRRTVRLEGLTVAGR